MNLLFKLKKFSALGVTICTLAIILVANADAKGTPQSSQQLSHNAKQVRIEPSRFSAEARERSRKKVCAALAVNVTLFATSIGIATASRHNEKLKKLVYAPSYRSIESSPSSKGGKPNIWVPKLGLKNYTDTAQETSEFNSESKAAIVDYVITSGLLLPVSITGVATIPLLFKCAVR